MFFFHYGYRAAVHRPSVGSLLDPLGTCLATTLSVHYSGRELPGILARRSRSFLASRLATDMPKRDTEYRGAEAAFRSAELSPAHVPVPSVIQPLGVLPWQAQLQGPTARRSRSPSRSKSRKPRSIALMQGRSHRSKHISPRRTLNLPSRRGQCVLLVLWFPGDSTLSWGRPHHRRCYPASESRVL